MIGFWIGYVAIAGLAVAITLLATRRLGDRWARHAVVSFVAALFVSPSFVIKGYGIGPAWMAGTDARSLGEFMAYCVAPITIVTIVIFVAIRMLVSSKDQT